MAKKWISPIGGGHFERVLGATMASRPLQNGAKMGVRCHLKSIKNRCKKKCHDFSLIFDRFSTPKSIKHPSKINPKAQQRKYQKSIKNVELSAILATSAMPCWIQKSIKNGPQKHFKSRLHFWSNLAPNWPQVGTPNRPKIDQKIIEKRRCNKMRPKWPRVDPTHPIPEGTTIIDPTIVGENGSVGGGKEGGITPSNIWGSNTPWAKGPANWSIDRLVDCPSDWLIDVSVDWLIKVLMVDCWLIDRLIGRSIC